MNNFMNKIHIEKLTITKLALITAYRNVITFGSEQKMNTFSPRVYPVMNILEQTFTVSHQS